MRFVEGYGTIKDISNGKDAGDKVFLHKAKRKGDRTYLTLRQGYRQDGKAKSRTVQSLGYLDDLEKQYVDPIAHFQAYCEEQNKLEKQKNQSVTIEIHPLEKIDKRMSNRKNIGSAALVGIYNALGIESTIRNATNKRKLDYDLNAVCRLLVTERILNPGPKCCAWENKDNYFFRTDFECHDMYRALSELAPLKHRIVSAINRSIEKASLRDTTSVYYDVTNYYFECDPDELRCKGVSKEHRPNPIVQMGLLQDKNALPISYKLFSGNTNDCNTMIDVLADMKQDHKLDRVIVVADKGLNTSDNIAACIAKGDGFVYSQSIRGTKSTSELRDWVCSDEDYVIQDGGEFKIKSRQDTKMINITNAQGEKKRVPIEVKTVAFWSAKYARRAYHERQVAIEKSRKLASNPGAYNASTHYGAAKYIRKDAFDATTGEVLNPSSVLSIDEERIAQEERCDGYYCLVTSEYDLPDEEIIDIYRGLWRIEESFRVTKSDLEARPVYCSTHEHIEAHFLTCYIALCVLRLAQLKCANRYSARVIAEQLGSLCGSSLEDNWWLFDQRSDISDDICEIFGIDLSRKYLPLKDIKKLLTQANHLELCHNKK